MQIAAEDYLDRLLEQTTEGKISSAELHLRLRELLEGFSDGWYRVKIRNAMQWANMRSGAAQTERYGRPEQLRSWLLQDLRSAAERLRRIRGQRVQDTPA